MPLVAKLMSRTSASPLPRTWLLCPEEPQWPPPLVSSGTQDARLPLDLNSCSRVASACFAKGPNSSNKFSARAGVGFRKFLMYLVQAVCTRKWHKWHQCITANWQGSFSPTARTGRAHRNTLSSLGRGKKKNEWMNSIQKKSTPLISICIATNTTKAMKSSVFKQYHSANIFLPAPLPSLRSRSCQPCLTPVWSWKGKGERTPHRTGAPAHSKGKCFSTSRRCLTPRRRQKQKAGQCTSDRDEITSAPHTWFTGRTI